MIEGFSPSSFFIDIFLYKAFYEHLKDFSSRSMISLSVTNIDISTGKIMNMKREIAIDKLLFVYLNDLYLASLITSPCLEKELAIGYLFTEGFIDSLEDIKQISVEGCKVNVKLAKEFNHLYGIPENTWFLNYSATELPGILDVNAVKSIDSEIIIPAVEILNMKMEFERRGKIHKKTRGTHSAALFSHKGEILSFAEDVTRHNAIDKVIGDALLKGFDFKHSVLFSSGRPSASMVLNAVKAQIPIFASIAYPSISGIMFAEEKGVTLVNVKRNSVKIFTHKERVLR